ncbi:hypothetical protein [Shouchella rhizosphaerae]|uniref:Uncharacterized protein n=1 Tax=Shouchella rhizosphaerae TaxID=866786 RepID=A0ABZ2CV54_9BACI
MKIKELDTERLYLILIKLPLVSNHANHSWIKSTLKDYVLPGENQLEAQFVKDIFTLKTEEIIEKWYGGDHSAYDLLSKLTN